jgi:hypothetical protein
LSLAALSRTVSIGAVPEPVTRGRVTYFFDHRHYLDGADSTLKVAARRVDKLLGVEQNFSYEVYLASSEASFDSLVGGRFPDWGAAAAIPHLKRIVVKSPDSFALSRPLAELLSHEYAHLALADRTGLNSAPRWFEEGFSMMASMQWSWEDNLAMNFAAVTGDLIPLREIDRVNRFAEGKARVAYAESYMTVQYLYDVYGADAVGVFLDEIASGRSLNRALMSATGSNYTDFDHEIRLYLIERFNLTGLVADTMYFWLALAFIVVIGFILTRMRRRRYYRAWEQAEKFHSTDFDYGDPNRPEVIDGEEFDIDDTDEYDPDDDEPWRP